MPFKFNPLSHKLDLVEQTTSPTGDVAFLTGNSGGAVPPDASHNINILGGNSQGINIVGNSGTNTLTVSGIDATTTQKGVVALATNAEAIAGTDTAKAITADDLKAKLGTQTTHSLGLFQGTSSAMTPLGAATNGQIPIGSTGADPVLALPISSDNSISVSGGAGSLNLVVNGGSTVGKTITGNIGGALLPAAGNWNILGGTLSAGTNAATTSGSGNTLTVTAINTAKWIVDPVANRGTHQTITAALAAASSGQTIFIRPGTYTENLTLKAGVNLTAFASDGSNGDFSSAPPTNNVTIVGKLTASYTGVASVTGIMLKTNSDNLISLTSANSNLNIFYCYLNAVNNTAIAMSAGGKMNIFHTNGDLGTTGIAYFAITAGTLNFAYNSFTNTGNATTASTNADGIVSVTHSAFNNPITTSGTGTFTSQYSVFAGIGNTTALTIGGSGSNAIDFTKLSSGSASAISISSTATVSCCEISSSNTNAITGAGTINYSNLSFTGTSSTINTTTKTAQYSDIAKYRATGQPTFQATFAAGATNVTGDGTAYQVAWDGTAFDVGSNFTTGAAAVFTAPIAGKYLLKANVSLVGLVATETILLSIITTGKTFNPFLQTGLVGTQIVGGSVIANMAAGDTANVTINVSGGAKTVSVQGNTNNSGFYGLQVA